MSSLKSDASGKPVWGNVRNDGVSPDLSVQSDFPTAAEVAHGPHNLSIFRILINYYHTVKATARIAKLQDAKDAADISSADKQARSVEADTFRGIHLDPNAHHWDEVI